MPKICYIDRKFDLKSLTLIRKCNSIIDEYTAEGFQLTLRQLYYQLVARDIIANKLNEYKRVGSIINDARLAGLIDWHAIEDRTRNLRRLASWNEPSEIVESAAAQFHVDMWKNQEFRPEVWIEKDALVGVIAGVCEELDVPYFSCRGYTSQSEMWVAAQRLRAWKQGAQTPVIFHLGDHDPSGKDMTRDIVDRMRLFMGGAKLERLALNMDQIEEYDPPPNPAKTTDSRSAGYIAEFGNESWELDALEPRVLADLIRRSVNKLIDKAEWKIQEQRKEEGREQLKKIAENWEMVVGAIEE